MFDPDKLKDLLVKMDCRDTWFCGAGNIATGGCTGQWFEESGFANPGDAHAINFDSSDGNSGGITVQRVQDDDHNLVFTVNSTFVVFGCLYQTSPQLSQCTTFPWDARVLGQNAKLFRLNVTHSSVC